MPLFQLPVEDRGTRCLIRVGGLAALLLAVTGMDKRSLSRPFYLPLLLSSIQLIARIVAIESNQHTRLLRNNDLAYNVFIEA